jgi:hypothetical protein
MPKPRKGEKKNDYISRCVREVMGEGKDQDAALGQCFGMWNDAHKLVEKSDMDPDALRLFIPITKVKVDQRLVYGTATAELPDRDGEICDYGTTRPLYQKWSDEIAKATDGKSFGNVREMHGNNAAGKLTSIAFDDPGRKIEVCAKVVDDSAWNKVLEGVYTGFSQGGRYVKRWRDDSTGLMRYTAEPIEISLVDLPCLPEATFDVIKADGVVEQRHFKTIDEKIVVETSTLRKILSAIGFTRRDPRDGPQRVPATELVDTVDAEDVDKGGDAPGEGDKPYGNVEYADPGYQSDGKKRYPIDTEAHVRAAWSYVNKPKNASAYTSDQLSRIKAKIVAAWKKFDSEGPPSASEKVWAWREEADEALEAGERALAERTAAIEKGMSWGVGLLAQAFDLIRQAQRNCVIEGRQEGDDPGDAACAEKLGALAAQLADCIAECAHHEGNESIDLSDADDVWIKAAKIVEANGKGVSDMDLDALKRMSATQKEACEKATMHFGKAADCYKTAGGHLNKAAAHAVENLKEAAAGAGTLTMKKADHASMLDHLHKARDAMSNGGDHMEIGQHQLGKAAPQNWGEGPSDITAPVAGDEYDGTRPVFGRAAASGGYSKEIVEQLLKAEQEKSAALAKAAAAEAVAEVYKSLPGGPKRAAIGSFSAVEKSFAAGAGGGDDRGDKLATLMKGVNVESDDPDSIAQGATQMLTNMFANSGKFARSVMDPGFHGKAGGKAIN